MDVSDRPCPQCGSNAVKRIVWTEDAAKIGTLADPHVAFVNGPAIWNERSEIDRECSVCHKRFCNDLLQQERYDEDTRRQKSRVEAMKRGEYMLFNPRTTSVDQIALDVFERVKLSKKNAKE